MIYLDDIEIYTLDFHMGFATGESSWTMIMSLAFVGYDVVDHVLLIIPCRPSHRTVSSGILEMFLPSFDCSVSFWGWFSPGSLCHHRIVATSTMEALSV